MKAFKAFINEANLEIEIPWDQDDPNSYADDFQEFGVYLNGWNKRGGFISLEGEKKALLKLLMDPDTFEMDKKEAMGWIKKGKKV